MKEKDFITGLVIDLEDATEHDLRVPFISIMLTTDDRDLIVKALREYASKQRE